MYNLMSKKKIRILLIVLSGIALLCPLYLTGKIKRLYFLVTSETDKLEDSKPEEKNTKDFVPRTSETNETIYSNTEEKNTKDFVPRTSETNETIYLNTEEKSTKDFELQTRTTNEKINSNADEKSTKDFEPRISTTSEKIYSNTGEKSSKPFLQRVVQLWTESDLRKLNPNDTLELMALRKAGRQEGIPLRHIINATNFISVPKPICEQRRKLVVLVSSSCNHRDHRDRIRRTWGNHSRLTNVPVIFFTGICDNAVKETVETDDVVVGNYVDSYYNLTFKSLSRLRWYMEYCSNSDYVLFCDDDVVVDSTVLLRCLPKNGNFSLVCSRNDFMPIIRDSKSGLAKWYVPKWLLEGNDYPPYCSGFAYLFNSTIIPLLYETSLNLPYIFVDDAFITGFATQELNIEVTGDRRFKVTNKEKVTCGTESVIASHWFKKVDFLREWRMREETCGYKNNNVKN